MSEELPQEIDLRNGGQRCDLITGPCACGAWHKLEDLPWRLQNQLFRHSRPESKSVPENAWKVGRMTIYKMTDGPRFRLRFVAGDEHWRDSIWLEFRLFGCCRWVLLFL